jgi:hypothetical protein
MTIVRLMKIRYDKYVKILQWGHEHIGPGLPFDDGDHQIKLSNEIKWSSDYNKDNAIFYFYSECDAIVFRLTWGCDGVL